MPKLITYPVDGLDLKKARELIGKLNDLGGLAERGTFAAKIDMSEKSGTFRGKISSMMKYNLIESKENEILLTNLAKDIINAYDEEEEKKLLFQCFINIQLFKELIERFGKSGLNLEILDKILIREYNIEQSHVRNVKNCITNSLDYIGMLNKETGKLDISLIQSSGVAKKVESIPEKTEDREEKLLNLKSVAVENHLKFSSMTLNSDIFNLIVFFASHLDPKDAPVENIQKILEENKFLTHTKLTFEILENNLKEKSISPENLKILLKALMEDLKI